MDKENRGKRAQAYLADIFELPRDILLDLSRLTLVGSRQLYLENHKGILHYRQGMIKVRVKSGLLTIKGEDLVLRSLYTAELYVEGEIHSLEIIR